jgi:hypothetical protein
MAFWVPGKAFAIGGLAKGDVPKAGDGGARRAS